MTNGTTYATSSDGGKKSDPCGYYVLYEWTGEEGRVDILILTNGALVKRYLVGAAMILGLAFNI